MNYSQAEKHYGSAAEIARVMGITRQAVFQWKEKGLIPKGSAAQLALLSDGKLKFDPSAYRDESESDAFFRPHQPPHTVSPSINPAPATLRASVRSTTEGSE